MTAAAIAAMVVSSYTWVKKCQYSDVFFWEMYVFQKSEYLPVL